MSIDYEIVNILPFLVGQSEQNITRTGSPTSLSESRVVASADTQREGPHSGRRLEAGDKQAKELQRGAKQVVSSVNVTLEVAADLSSAVRVIWYRNQQELTSSERPVYYVRAHVGADSSGGGERKRGRSIKRTRSKRAKATLKSTSDEGGQIIEQVESTTHIEEELKLVDDLDEQGQEVCGGKLGGRGAELSEQLIEKCRQESNERGSKLTIFNLQDEDYGRYSCRLVDLESEKTLSVIEANLNAERSSEETNLDSGRKQQQQQQASRQLQLTKLIAMDEVIEVREGDLNIELGIQILPETNEDEELMSEEEKAEFVAGTTISWFKDDVKLDPRAPEVLKLFQFAYEPVEGFHRLIVRKASKKTEGVYTCVVENESGTSTCSTQLVVGPGNKPKLTSQLQDVTVYVGQTLEFRIKSTGLPPIESCQWFKDDELLIELATSAASDEVHRSRGNERIGMSRSEEWSGGASESDKVLIFRLAIDGLKLDDTGRYKCRINNQFGYDETDCFVKVLQEIIEEHEEIEETIEETLRVGAKRATREEEEEAEEVTTTEEVSTQREAREVKRQRQERDELMETEADGGRAARFKRTLDKVRVIRVEEETSTTTTTTETTRVEELVVSTCRSDDSSRRDKISWLVDGRQLDARGQESVDVQDESVSYRCENYFDETGEEFLHKLIIKYRSQPAGGSRGRSIECQASNEFGSDRTSGQLRWRSKPRFLRKLEDIETNVGETVRLKVSVDEEQVDESASDLRLLHESRRCVSVNTRSSTSAMPVPSLNQL